MVSGLTKHTTDPQPGMDRGRGWYYYRGNIKQPNGRRKSTWSKYSQIRDGKTPRLPTIVRNVEKKEKLQAHKSDYKTRKAKSNNPLNPNQNICALAVARHYHVADKVRYLHKMPDLVKALRFCYTVRSRKSAVKKNTVGGMRKDLVELTTSEQIKGNTVRGYVVRVRDHVIAMNKFGQTVVDTDSRKKDKRRVTHVYVVYN